MAIDIPKSDLERSVQNNPDHNWPKSVKIQLAWEDENGRVAVRTELISSDAFFGHGSHGAPMQGEAIIQMIERMRRAGPPKVERKALTRKYKR